MPHLSKQAVRVYRYLHHIHVTRFRLGDYKYFPLKLETIARQKRVSYQTVRLAVDELLGWRRVRAGGKAVLQQAGQPLITTKKAMRFNTYGLQKVDVDKLLLGIELDTQKTASGSTLSISTPAGPPKQADFGPSGSSLIIQGQKLLETKTKTTSETGPQPDPGQDQGKSDDVGLHPVERQVQKQQVEKRPRVSNTVLTLEDAVDHPRLTTGQPNAVDIRLGADLILTREGRPVAEELADLGYRPTTLAVWRKYLAYVARYEIDGLRDLVREVRANGKRNMGGYAAHWINAGLQAPAVQIYVRGGAPAQEAPAYVRPIEARPEGVHQPPALPTLPAGPQDAERDAGLSPMAQWRLSTRQAGATTAEAAG